jgi:hypothetical protein
LIFAIWPEQDLYNTMDATSGSKSPYPQLKDYNPYYQNPAQPQTNTVDPKK